MAFADFYGLTDGEKLTIDRRRKGLSVLESAASLGVHRNTYAKMERKAKVEGIPIPNVRQLEDHEICFIMRRRKGWTQQECANMMGITRFWFNQMEKGHETCASLSEFWGK